MKWKSLLALIGTSAVVACADAADPVAVPQLTRAASSAAYIVQLKSDAPPGLARQLAAAEGLHPRHVYARAIQGFAAAMPAAQAEALRHHPAVLRVEVDGRASLADTVVQVLPTDRYLWGLGRLNDRTYTGDFLYSYDGTGAGVHVYIVDTGLDPNHQEYAGRYAPGVTFIPDVNGTLDCNGHGTHVAGTVAGTLVGVAKQAIVHPVRVMSCEGSGSWSDIIAGVEWVIANAQRPAVLNASIGGLAVASVNDAFAAAVSANVAVAVAAGNNAADACEYSPASTPSVLTVGATGALSDDIAGFSNVGACLDLFAPGWNIESSVPGGGYAVMSGTSMATPHVAGALAIAFGAHPSETAGQIQERVRALATQDVVLPTSGTPWPTGTPNLMLYTLGLGNGTASPPPPPPTSQLTVTPSSVALTAPAGGDTVRATLQVANPVGLGGLVATVNVPWLRATLLATGELTLAAAPGTLAPGTYPATLILTQAGAVNSPLSVPVTFTVTGSEPPPPPPSDAVPVASFTGKCTRATCALDASASVDDHGLVEYRWQVSDGRSFTTSGPWTSVTFATKGTFTVTLRVVDTAGQVSAPVARSFRITKKL